MSRSVCIVKNCVNSKSDSSCTAKISFFKLPSDAGKAEKWLSAAGGKIRQSIIQLKNYIFCEKHFQESDIMRSYEINTTKEVVENIPRDRVKLKSTAIPLIFPTPKKQTQSCYWFNKRCCVPECGNCSTMGGGCGKEYFDLPAEPQARSRWLKVILVNDAPDLKVCEDHFKDDEDIFLDKNNRKKLKVNSTPSIKLPKLICTKCLGSKQPKRNGSNAWEKGCECRNMEIFDTSLKKSRTRLPWTYEEKRTLFKVVRKYGEVKYNHNIIRINWDNIYKHSKKSCLGQREKDLKTAWQALRIKANKVVKREIEGSKLERKVARFLICLRTGHQGTLKVNDLSESSNKEELPQEPEQQINDNNFEKTEANDMEVKEEESIQNSDQENYNSDSENEHYSLADIEEKFGIKINPVTEVISLLSSDESDFEM